MTERQYQLSRFFDPRNPLREGWEKKTDYQKWTRRSCEVHLLLWDREVDEDLEAHHALTRDLFELYAVPVLEDHPFNLYTFTNAKKYGQIHLMWGHLCNFQIDNVRLGHVMKHAWEFKYGEDFKGDENSMLIEFKRITGIAA